MAEEGQRPTDRQAEASFSSLALSLAMSALQQMTEPEKPGQPTSDYRLAKPMIDSLEMLKEKTKGNLTAAETALLDSLLFDLRLRFLKAGSPPVPEAAATPQSPPEEKPERPG